MMELIPAYTPELLGFDTLRTRLEALALSDSGRERIRNLVFWTDPEVIRGYMERTEALKNLLLHDDPFPLEPWPDLRPLFRQAAVMDVYLPGAHLVQIARWLRQVRTVRAYLERRRARYGLLWESFGSLIPLPELEEAIFCALFDDGGVRPDASPELRRLSEERAVLGERLHRRLDQILSEWAMAGLLADEQPAFRGGRLLLPVQAEHKRRVAGFIHDVSSTGQTVYVEPAALLELNNELRALEAEIQRQQEAVLRELTARLRRHLPELEYNLELMARLDELQARARLAIELMAEMPELDGESRVLLREARHPGLWLSRPDKSTVVPLDLELGTRSRVLVISGPNAGGKSVAMKTVGLLVLMAHAGLLLPAHPKSRIGLFARMGVDIGDAQSVEQDLSTFSAHLERQRAILERADARTLVLIDELGTATDPEEGGALGGAILDVLLERGARVIVTTHHGAIKAWALRTPGAENGSMAFDEERLQPTYRFRPGVPGRSYAFEIARRIGIPDFVLERARHLARLKGPRLDEVLASWEAERRAFEEARRRLEAELQALERERRELAERRAALEQEVADIRARALKEAETLLREARARIERTIREIREGQAEREHTRRVRSELERFEQEVRSERRALEQKRGARATPRPIQVGDWVELIEHPGAPARVLELSASQAVVLLGGLKLRTSLDRIRPAASVPREEPASGIARSSSLPLALRAGYELDIRGMRASEAREVVERFLDEALAAGLERVRIIHGKGDGVLRQVVHEVARSHPAVSGWVEARPEEGGAGVSILMLR